MTSQLNVDTIVDKAGSGGTNVKVNNNSTYVDGSDKSQNMVAALPKGWINMTLAGTTARSDSLNVGSITDHGTGEFTWTFSNNFNYEGYCTQSLSGGHDSGDGNYDYISGNFDQLTSASRIYCFNRSAGAARDATSMSMLWTGDLA